MWKSCNRAGGAGIGAVAGAHGSPGAIWIPTARQDRALMGVFIIELLVRLTAYGWNLSSLLAKV